VRLLFLTKNGYLPQVVGGAEWSVHRFATGLRAIGHEVAVLAQLDDSGWIGFQNKLRRRLGGAACPVDRNLGYPVHRGWDLSSGLRKAVAAWKPEVVLVAGIGSGPVPLALEAAALGLPVIYMVMDISFEHHGGSLADLRDTRFTSNSEFTAERLRDTFGLESTLVYPPVDADKCRVAGTGKKIVMINPRESKGVLIALALAEARPDIPFVFYETWSRGLSVFKERAAKAGNIEWRSPVLDARKVYEDARIVLVPSQAEEAWGKVASEAQCSGIPVLGSDIGGLTESIGDGGIRLPFDAPPADWLAALGQLWDCPHAWKSRSEIALARSRRPGIQLSEQIGTLDTLLASTRRCLSGLSEAPGTSLHQYACRLPLAVAAADAADGSQQNQKTFTNL
jgi:glycosyltransferase involved in cell wall biosynthesis